MFSKGGGGSIDTSGIEEATNRAIDLQKEMYDTTRADVQPWYQMGTGSVSRLSDLLGIGGGSMRNEAQLREELLPQFTSQQAGPTSGFYGDSFGGVFSDRDAAAKSMRQGYVDQNDGGPTAPWHRFVDGVEELSPAATSVVDSEALQNAINERLNDQQVPDDYGSLLERFDLTKFEEDPGYAFRQQEAQRALERNMAAQGVTLGGGGVGEINPQVARALEEQSQGLASQEYGNAYNRYVQDNLNTYNMLMGTAGMGQGSTGIMATAGQGYADNVGNLTTGLASAQMNAQMAQAAQPGMFDSLLGTAGMLGAAYLTGGAGAGAAAGGASSVTPTAMMMGGLSDVRAKENITKLGVENGHQTYEFSYKGDGRRFIGVMAQDIQKTNPDAVNEVDGVLYVDYPRIGVEMREV